ncbi:MAG: hypothetical protein KDA63_08375 [Planctomycetales bacterium]|nr:hypothetical protein [Planctomycetales bacterium]
MDRILPVIALFALVFVCATLALGLSLGDVSNPKDTTTQRWATVHRLSGVAAALVVLLVDSIVVTYFVGTSRWCKEVVETYDLDRLYIARTNKLKRRTFPLAVSSMLTMVVVVALGGAADPGASMRLEPIAGVAWSRVHLFGALLGVSYVALGFYLMWQNVWENGRVLADVVQRVAEIRKQRGLEG